MPHAALQPLMYVVVATPIAVIIVLGVYAKFRTGLALRMYGTVIVLCYFVCGLAYAAGVDGRSSTLTLSALVAAVVFTVSLFVLYRSVVTRTESMLAESLSGIAKVSSASTALAATATEQASTVAELSATVHEMTQSASASAALAAQVSRTSANATAQGLEGVHSIEEASKILHLISQVTNLVESVRDFAEQSNMLAVNAGIEAAKAGDAGRGFRVVATEIRSLAEQSKQRTQSIRNAVLSAQDGRRSMELAHVAISKLGETLADNRDRANQIAASAAEQSAAIRQICEAMANVAEGGRNTQAAAQELAGAARSLARAAEDLQRFVSGERAHHLQKRTEHGNLLILS